jgi:hypothetical protein
MKKIGLEVSQAFSKGLTSGFAGKSTFEKIVRGKFQMVSSLYSEEDILYIDQWFPGHMGGGQEILEVDGKRYTRVYAGGTVEDSILLSLGISKTDVMAWLKKILLEVGEKTRFDEPHQQEDDAWSYQYTPGLVEETTGMITGKEIISYKNTPVFVHFFIISSVSE